MAPPFAPLPARKQLGLGLRNYSVGQFCEPGYGRSAPMHRRVRSGLRRRTWACDGLEQYRCHLRGLLLSPETGRGPFPYGLNRRGRRSWCLLWAKIRPPILLQLSSPRDCPRRAGSAGPSRGSDHPTQNLVVAQQPSVHVNRRFAALGRSAHRLKLPRTRAPRRIRISLICLRFRANMSF